MGTLRCSCILEVIAGQGHICRAAMFLLSTGERCKDPYPTNYAACCAVVGSMTFRTSVTLLAGKPLNRACSWTIVSFFAR